MFFVSGIFECLCVGVCVGGVDGCECVWVKNIPVDLLDYDSCCKLAQIASICTSLLHQE